MTETPAPESRLDVAVVLGLLFLLASVLAALAFVPIPEKNSSLFSALAMGVIGGLNLYLGYRWGASKSGATKDETIKAMLPKDGVQ